jgi:hypothetical protein
MSCIKVLPPHMPYMMSLLLFNYLKRSRCHCLEFTFEFVIMVTLDTHDNIIETLEKVIYCTIVDTNFSSTNMHWKIHFVLQLVTDRHDSIIYKLVL